MKTFMQKLSATAIGLALVGAIGVPHLYSSANNHSMDFHYTFNCDERDCLELSSPALAQGEVYVVQTPHRTFPAVAEDGQLKIDLEQHRERSDVRLGAMPLQVFKDNAPLTTLEVLRPLHSYHATKGHGYIELKLILNPQLQETQLSVELRDAKTKVPLTARKSHKLLRRGSLPFLLVRITDSEALSALYRDGISLRLFNKRIPLPGKFHITA